MKGNAILTPVILICSTSLLWYSFATESVNLLTILAASEKRRLAMKPVFLPLILLFVALMPAAQSPVPVEKEPRHHLKFENRYTRVFDVVVPPGDATLFHTHSNDYVFVSIGDAALKAELQGSPAVDLFMKDGETRYTKATITHRVMNYSKSTFRNITIEILASPPSAGGSSLEKVPGHTLLFENERVRAWRLSLEPGQTTGTHSHGRAGLGVSVSGGQLLITGADGKSRKATVKPGDFQWHEARTTHSLQNTGKQRFEAVDIEWK
jgi:quercetin dioxygenase-like cupin family protein